MLVVWEGRGEDEMVMSAMDLPGVVTATTTATATATADKKDV